MSGRTEVIGLAIVGISAIALVTDLFWGRIYNWTTLTGILVGLGISFWFSGWSGLGESLLCVLLALVFYGWMFFFGYMGGGDVKLLMALGAMGGVHYLEEVALMGIVLGGVLSVIVLTIRGRMIQFLRKIYYFLMSLFVKELDFTFPDVDKKLKMPFGVALSIGAVWTYYFHPLVKWGFLPWP